MTPLDTYFATEFTTNVDAMLLRRRTRIAENRNRVIHAPQAHDVQRASLSLRTIETLRSVLRHNAVHTFPLIKSRSFKVFSIRYQHS